MHVFMLSGLLMRFNSSIRKFVAWNVSAAGRPCVWPRLTEFSSLNARSILRNKTARGGIAGSNAIELSKFQGSSGQVVLLIHPLHQFIVSPPFYSALLKSTERRHRSPMR